MSNQTKVGLIVLLGMLLFLGGLLVLAYEHLGLFGFLTAVGFDLLFVVLVFGRG